VRADAAAPREAMEAMPVTDLVTSFEVAEQLPPANAAPFVDLLTAFRPKVRSPISSWQLCRPGQSSGWAGPTRCWAGAEEKERHWAAERQKNRSGRGVAAIGAMIGPFGPVLVVGPIRRPLKTSGG